MSKIIGFTYDPIEEFVFEPSDAPDANAEHDYEDTVDFIADAIRANGHKVIKIGSAKSLLQKLPELKVDIVFNLAEGRYGRNRESEVPLICEMIKIPYVGSDALTMSLTMDKAMTKKILRAEGIPTAKYCLARSPKDVEKCLEKMAFPMIVKPNCEGSSKGMSEKSKVNNLEELKKQATYIINTYCQPALVEEFISGREYTVGIIGNENPEILPAAQIRINNVTDLGDNFYTFTRVNENNELDYTCENIPEEMAKKLSDLALATYRAVDCLDFGRVDFRVDKNNNPYVLELNALPCLSNEDVFAVVADYLKIPFSDIMKKILNAAFTRYQMTP